MGFLGFRWPVTPAKIMLLACLGELDGSLFDEET